MIKKTVFAILLISMLIQLVRSQSPFSRGVNLTLWFQTSGARQLQFTKFTKHDFENIKSLRCDVIRLPINLHFMTSGDPYYTLDPLFLSFLDSAVNWAEELQIHLLLDNHTFDPSVDTDPLVESVLIKVWTQMAEHYKDRSNYIYYEILNEPHGIADALWSEIQQNVIDAIRIVDTKHTIVVGPAGWNSYNNLNSLPVYSDDNLIYTFHFYDPFLFTHQGASWTDPSMESLAGVPFPYNADSMPACPDDLLGTWVEGSLNNYDGDGTVERVKELVDIAADFKVNRNVPVFCGEFGAYTLSTPRQDRLDWYDTVRTYFESKNLAWTIWDYTGSFGIFEIGGNDMFEYDLDTALVRALGLNVPAQEEFFISPDTAGFRIYSDYIENHIVESGYAGNGIIDFYNENHPNNGKYCIYWSGGVQYSYIGFDFKPNKDLSVLLEHDYAIDFLVRGTSPGTKIDIRFVDTKTDTPNDHPWRMRYTIDGNSVSWDGRWHHIYVPLTNFTEQGSYDQGWFDPVGDYDWTAADRFEIVAEYHDLDGKSIWFDNVHITNMDTAIVRDTTMIINSIDDVTLSDATLNMVPNPAKSNVTIYYSVLQRSLTEISIYSISGKRISSLIDRVHIPGNYSVTWNCHDSQDKRVESGIYFCRIVCAGDIQARKIIVL